MVEFNIVLRSMEETYSYMEKLAERIQKIALAECKTHEDNGGGHVSVTVE